MRFKALSVGVSSLILVVTFQNCGQSGLQDDSSLSELSSHSKDPKILSLPFPYQVSVNQIAYMSCPNDGNASNGLFTFKVGAYSNELSQYPLANQTIAGLSLKADYLKSFQSTFEQVDQDLGKKWLLQALTTAPLLSTAQLHLSLRSKSDIKGTALFRRDTSSAQLSSALPALNNLGIVNEFTAHPNSTANYFSTVTTEDLRTLDSAISIPVSNSEQDQSSFRSLIMNNILVFSFSNVASQVDPEFGPKPLGPSDVSATGDATKIFGRGFSAVFGVPNTVDTATAEISYPYRVLRSPTIFDPAYTKFSGGIFEQNLETSEQDKTVGWDCRWQFKIVKEEDRDLLAYKSFDINGNSCATKEGCRRAICPIEKFEQLQSSPAKMQALTALRKMLPVENFDVNMTERCIVPKSNNSCYQDVNTPIVYDDVFFAGATADSTQGKFKGCVGGSDPKNTQFQCVHYLSFCYRRPAN